MIFRLNLRHLTITLSRWTMNLRFAHDLWDAHVRRFFYLVYSEQHFRLFTFPGTWK